MADPVGVRPARKPYRTIIVIVGLLIAVNVIIVAGLSQKTNTAGTLPSAIEPNGLEPKPGDVVSPETAIQVNLSNNLQGFLEFDGAVIPQDQLETQPTEGIIGYTPAPGKDLATLPRGSHTVTVVYWPRGQKESEGTGSYSWRFTVGA